VRCSRRDTGDRRGRRGPTHGSHRRGTGGTRPPGRVVNALGVPIDGKGPIESRRIADRAEGARYRSASAVKEPLQTGIKAIDTMIPSPRTTRADHR